MELTKQFVEKTKKNGEEALISLVCQFERDSSKINFILENLGHIPKEFKGDWLFKYAQNKNHRLRMSAIKNIGKLNLNGELEQLYKLFDAEPKTENKREIISSIGRQRNIETKWFLIKVLKDDDPKIVCQAIRALLSFKTDEGVIKELKNSKYIKMKWCKQLLKKSIIQITKDKARYATLKHTIF